MRGGELLVGYLQNAEDKLACVCCGGSSCYSGVTNLLVTLHHHRHHFTPTLPSALEGRPARQDWSLRT